LFLLIDFTIITYIAGLPKIESWSLGDRKQITLCERCDVWGGWVANKDGFGSSGDGEYTQFCDLCWACRSI